jgi:hypothetical protein
MAGFKSKFILVWIKINMLILVKYETVQFNSYSMYFFDKL